MQNVRTLKEYSFSELIELEKWIEEQKGNIFPHYGQFALNEGEEVIMKKIKYKIHLIRSAIWDKLDDTISASSVDINDF